MNRQDIIDKMTPSEKKVFEKYKDTYPFPIRKFIEEIGIKIVCNEDEQNLAEMYEKDGAFYMHISKHHEVGVQAKDMSYLVLFMHHLFTRNNAFLNEYTCEIKKLNEEMKILLSVFLMPLDVFKRQVRKFNCNAKKLSKYFGVPTGAIEFYAEYLKAKTIGLDPYSNSDDNIEYH